MKALIRNEGETVTEADGIPGIDWNTGMPLTCPDWAGGPYRLADNYIEVADGAIYDVAAYPDADIVPTEPTPVVKVNPDMPVPVGGTIVIDGVTYIRTS